MNTANTIKNSLVLYFNIVLISLGCFTKVNAQVFRGEQTTVSIGNTASWTGRNGTGNLSYYGCDRSSPHNAEESKQQVVNPGNCIYLTGGKITCRDGFCRTTWQNKNYSYVLSSPITETTIGAPASSILKVYSDSNLVREEKLDPLPFDNI